MQSPAEHAERYRQQISALAQWRRSPHDILCFQEVNPLAERFDELSEALSLEGGACLANAGVKLAGHGVPIGLQEGLGILAGPGFKHTVFDQLTLSGSAWEVQSPRGAPWLVLQTGERRKALLMESQLEGKRIAVVVLHLHHGPDTGAENLARKSSEIEKLCKWLSPRLDQWDALAVCGDFNCAGDSPCLQSLLALGFKDTAELAGIVQSPTWVPQENSFAQASARLADSAQTREWDGAAHIFDRIYLRTLGAGRVIAHELFKEPTLSDHFGVWAEISI